MLIICSLLQLFILWLYLFTYNKSNIVNIIYFCCSDICEHSTETEWAVTTTSHNGCTKTMIFKQKSGQKTDFEDDKDNSTLPDTLIMVFLKENLLLS